MLTLQSSKSQILYLLRIDLFHRKIKKFTFLKYRLLSPLWCNIITFYLVQYILNFHKIAVKFLDFKFAPYICYLCCQFLNVAILVFLLLIFHYYILQLGILSEHFHLNCFKHSLLCTLLCTFSAF